MIPHNLLYNLDGPVFKFTVLLDVEIQHFQLLYTPNLSFYSSWSCKYMVVTWYSHGSLAPSAAVSTY